MCSSFKTEKSDSNRLQLYNKRSMIKVADMMQGREERIFRRYFNIDTIAKNNTHFHKRVLFES